jgi:hypothetical protein
MSVPSGDASRSLTHFSILRNFIERLITRMCSSTSLTQFWVRNARFPDSAFSLISPSFKLFVMLTSYFSLHQLDLQSYPVSKDVPLGCPLRHLAVPIESRKPGLPLICSTDSFCLERLLTSVSSGFGTIQLTTWK